MIESWEMRTFTGDVEVRDLGDHPAIVGYAALFDVRSADMGGFIETIDRRAFNRTIDQADIRALRNHNPDLLLGRVKAGTLHLSVDERGLAYQIDMPATTVGKDTLEMIRRGDMTGSSFGFRAVDDDWKMLDDGRALRTLNEVAVRDVGPVTFPAYSEAPAALRSLAESRSLDINVLIEAAQAGELRSVLAEGNDTQEPADTSAPLTRRLVPKHF